MKKCNKCGEAKSISEYFKAGKHPSGKVKMRGDCKACAKRDTSEWRKNKRAHYNEYMSKYRVQNPDKIREHEIKKLYGISGDDLRQMTASQDNKCKICRRPPSGKRPLAIDHCHSTGRVRGLLCYRCNLGVAFLEAPGILPIALKYLK